MYSLRGITGNQGIGTIAEFRRLADLCENVGVEVVGTLPLLAAFPDQPSPYAPASRRAWNEVFVDFSTIPGWSGATPTASAESRWVDHESVGRDIRARLATYSSQVSETPQLRTEVDSFLLANPEMGRYAEFMAMADHDGRNWRAWGPSVAPDPRRVAYHETVQWLMHTQLTELSDALRDRGQYLYLDLPIGCHADGFDVWSDPDLFAGASLGAPPDGLFVNGQDWGLPASMPSVARRNGHADFRKAVAKQFSVAGLLRIDHVMGILRTWWVPHGSDARHGAYVKHAADEMFAIICIESVRANASVVGENLGTVPPEITQGLVDHEILGMAGNPEAKGDPGADVLVAVTSHDTPAFATWWTGADIDDLAELGVFDEARSAHERNERARSVAGMQNRFGTGGLEETRDALLGWMAQSDAAVALVNIDDLLLEDRRQNIPGTYTERPNWRLRHDRSIDDLATDDQFTQSLRSLVAMRHTQ
jgi:4-alpha-glucanotransferase